MQLSKYSFGVGDRFGRQGRAQLAAIRRAAEQGVAVSPVWNKSHREHSIIGTTPADVRAEADAAASALGWTEPYFVDADHINLKTVDAFIAASDFFTIDVADFIGRPASDEDIKRFVARRSALIGRLTLPVLNHDLIVTGELIESAALKYLAAVQEAGRVYRRIESSKGRGRFVAEISMDETDQPQTPLDLLLILAAAADEGISVQTIAPRFSGRFNKGVDYVGEVDRFAAEFRQDLAALAFAVREFPLPKNLKLSIHSGSDKFSIYGPIRAALREFEAGIHVKTAGTTWLAELTGLAEAGGEGLQIARECYRAALTRREELCAPYASVIDIDPAGLPTADVVDRLDGPALAAVFRHDQTCPTYNSNVRQLLHVGYKVAAEMGDRYLRVLADNTEIVSREVEENLYYRHLCPLFGLI